MQPAGKTFCVLVILTVFTVTLIYNESLQGSMYISAENLQFIKDAIRGNNFGAKSPNASIVIPNRRQNTSDCRATELMTSIAQWQRGAIRGNNFGAKSPNAHIVIPNRRYNTSDCCAREPVTSIAPWQRVKYPERKWNGLQLPVIVMDTDGRLGNMMGNYASIYAIGKAYKANVGITKQLYRNLRNIFPNLTLPHYDVAAKRAVRLPFYGNYVYGDKEAAAAGLLGPHIFHADGWPMEIQLFNAYPCNIRKEFTFHPRLQNKVDSFWLSHKERIQNATLVGFHIRRTDYVKYVTDRNEKLPGIEYFENAMDYYKKIFSKIVFVVATDDQSFTRKTFINHTDIIHVPGKEREVDMAILSSCDHSIMTVGTFGFWSSYLAGGWVVYPDGFHINNYPIQKDRFDMSHLDFFVAIPAT